MGKGETKMQPTHPVTDPRNPIALGSANARAIFISHTYAHLMGAIVAFTLLKVLLFSTSLTQSIARALDGVNWVLVVGAFMVVSWLATRSAHTAECLGS